MRNFPNFSIAQLRKYFGPGSDARLANSMAKSDRALYEESKIQAVSKGILSPGSLSHSNYLEYQHRCLVEKDRIGWVPPASDNPDEYISTEMTLTKPAPVPVTPAQGPTPTPTPATPPAPPEDNSQPTRMGGKVFGPDNGGGTIFPIKVA